MRNHIPINHPPARASLSHWLRQLSHWTMTSAVRVFLLTLAALLGSLLLNGMVQGVGESRPLMDAADLITQLDPYLPTVSNTCVQFTAPPVASCSHWPEAAVKHT